MDEYIKKSDVMHIINTENAVVLCCTRLRTTDEVLCSIASQINSLQTKMFSLSGKWRRISVHRDDDDGNILRDYECSACLGIIRDVPDTTNPELELDRFCPMCGARMDGDTE